MSLQVIKAGKAEISHVLRHARALDRREIFALMPRDDDAMMVEILMAYAAQGVVCEAWLHDGLPIGICIITGNGIGCGYANMIATADWGLISTAATRRVAGYIMPSLIRRGMFRVECRALEANRVAVRWLRFLGAVEECRLPALGRHREPYLQFAWRLDDVREHGWAGSRRGAPRNAV